MSVNLYLWEDYTANHVITQAVDFASLTVASISFILEILILGFSYYIYKTPVARQHLDRVSFRLLLVAIFLGAGYDMAWMISLSEVSRVKIFIQSEMLMFKGWGWSLASYLRRGCILHHCFLEHVSLNLESHWV
jgi:hypothetical protein